MSKKFKVGFLYDPHSTGSFCLYADYAQQKGWEVVRFTSLDEVIAYGSVDLLVVVQSQIRTSE